MFFSSYRSSFCDVGGQKIPNELLRAMHSHNSFYIITYDTVKKSTDAIDNSIVISGFFYTSLFLIMSYFSRKGTAFASALLITTAKPILIKSGITKGITHIPRTVPTPIVPEFPPYTTINHTVPMA